MIEVNAAVEFTSDYPMPGRDPFRAAAEALLAAWPARAAEAAAFSSFLG